MTAIYHVPYSTPVGRKLKKYLTKKFSSRKEYVNWLATHNVIVKELR